MRILILSCLAGLLAAPVAADYVCEEAWFSRNLIFDRAGYCFGSNLGQAVFDNSDCTTSAPDLNKRRTRKVSDFKAFEAEMHCRVDTSANRLRFFDDTARLRQLRDVPVMDRLGSGCIGYRGPTVVLRRGHGARTAQIGQISAGDSISFQHWGEGKWDYVTIYDGANAGAHGWADFPDLGEDACDQWAG